MKPVWVIALAMSVGCARTEVPPLPQDDDVGSAGDADDIGEALQMLLGRLSGHLGSGIDLAHLLPKLEALVGDVQGGQHRDAQAVDGPARPGDFLHLLVDVGGQLLDVRGVVAAADRVVLAEDLNVHEVVLVGHGRGL